MIQSFSLQGKRDSNEDQHLGVLNITNTDKTINPVNFIFQFGKGMLLKAPINVLFASVL